MLKFQRKNLIETDSSSADSDDNKRLDTIRLMDNKNPLIRLAVYGRLKRILKTYQDLDLNNLELTDKRLIKGIFVKSLQDFDEDHAKK